MAAHLLPLLLLLTGGAGALHLKVGTIQSLPFLRVLGEGGGFEGYIPDLLQDIAETKGFSYSLVLSEDHEYGVKGEGGNWTGLVGMLHRGEIDMIAADLTETWSRMAVVDFSKPFLATSLTLLLQDPSLPPSLLWRWLAPLSPSLWLLLLLSSLVTLSLLWLSTRLAPKERRHPPTLGDLLTRVACPWLAWQSSWTPKTGSSRCITCTWALLHLLLLLLYVLHLPQHLLHRPAPRSTSVDQVLSSTGQAAVLRGGSTEQLLRNSVNPVHKALWSSSRSVADTAAGLDVVREGGVLVLEGLSAGHLVEQDCSLYTVGRLEDRRYAFAFTKGSRHRRMFSDSLLSLTEQGKLSAARLKWWPPPSCPAPAPLSPTNAPPASLDLEQLSPLLLLFLILLLLSLLLLLLELVRPLAKQGELSLLPSLLWQLLCPGARAGETGDWRTFPPSVRPSVATQTVLWSSSRAASPSADREPLSQRLYREKTGSLVKPSSWSEY